MRIARQFRHIKAVGLLRLLYSIAAVGFGLAESNNIVWLFFKKDAHTAAHPSPTLRVVYGL